MSKNNEFVYDEEEFRKAAKKSGKFFKKFGWIAGAAIVDLIIAYNST